MGMALTPSHQIPSSFQEAGALPSISEPPALAHIGHEAMVISNFNFTKRGQPVLQASPPPSSIKSVQSFHSWKEDETTWLKKRTLVCKGHRQIECSQTGSLLTRMVSSYPTLLVTHTINSQSYLSDSILLFVN